MSTPRKPPHRSPLRVSVDVERLHFFDPESEEAIW